MFNSPKALDYLNFFGDNFSVYKTNLSDSDPRFGFGNIVQIRVNKTAKKENVHGVLLQNKT